LKYQAAVSLRLSQTNDDFILTRRYQGGIAMFLFINTHPPNIPLSKKVCRRHWDITGYGMNSQII